MIWVLILAVVALGALLALCASAHVRVTLRARAVADGTQEARVIVQKGYRPDRIELEAGVPATLRFDRREDDACTELLVSELWPSAHRLVAHGETEIRFIPERAGRYVFTCGMGMYSGELVVHERRVV